MQMKLKILLVMCLVKSYSLFDYNHYDLHDDNYNLTSTSTTELTTRVTDNPEDLIGRVCVLRYKDKRFRRVTYVKTYRELYVAECCGGLKNCTRAKKVYRFKEDYKELEPLQRYHQVCCKGYERDYADPYLPGGNIKCVHICDPPCINGTCVGPQQCKCYNQALIINPDRKYECIDACLSKCKDATCVDIQLCQCDFGYESIDDKFCRPVCPGGCTNGKCILPFKCKCNPGYIQDPEDRNLCNPICTNGCLNGTCIGPELCKCPPGEKFDTAFKTCIPRLCFNDCGVGTCIPSPDRCICPYNYLYSKDNDTCVALCNSPCFGGVCVSPNNCKCFKNFQKVSSGCIDSCRNKCGYGKCMPNGECICDEKLYVKPKNIVQKRWWTDSHRYSHNKNQIDYWAFTHILEHKHLDYYHRVVMYCIPRADNCFETGGKVLAPWICKCPNGKRYVRPNEQQIKELGLKKNDKYCLTATDVSEKYIERLESFYEMYKDVDLIP